MEQQQTAPLPTDPTGHIESTLYRESKVRRSAGRWVAWVMVFIGGIAMVGNLIELMEGDPDGNAGGGAAVGGALFLGGLFWIRSAGLTYRRRKKEEIERTILQIAAENRGRINVATLCRQTWLTADQASEELQRLALGGTGQVDYDDDGRIFYTF